MKGKRNGTFFNILLLIWAAVPLAAFAQQAAEGAEEVELTLEQMIMQGGWAMIPLGLLSIAMFGFILQNALLLREKKMLRADLLPVLRKNLAGRLVREAVALCRAENSLLTTIMAAGLERCDVEDLEMDNIKEAIEDASTEQMAAYMKPINYLSIIGAIAPMLGLLGTVSGMIKAFQHIGTKGMGNPAELAGNIGEALVTTATGLIIAIPAMLCYFYFKNSFIKTMATLGREIGMLLDALRTGKLPSDFELPEESAMPAEEAE
jgi:biopolymer transport protein ExbB